MGVDCKIYLPYNVRLSEVAKVIGILAGQKIVEKEDKAHNFKYFEVEGVSIEPCGKGLETCANIFVEGLTGAAATARNDNGDNAFVMFHFEPSNPTPETARLLMPRATAFWIAIGIGLVKFFGGEIDFNDCDSKETDFQVKVKSNLENCPEDGPSWAGLQNRIREITPLTKKDFVEAEKHSSY
jgi:hypothetical protein